MCRSLAPSGRGLGSRRALHGSRGPYCIQDSTGHQFIPLVILSASKAALIAVTTCRYRLFCWPSFAGRPHCAAAAEATCAAAGSILTYVHSIDS